MSSLVALWLVAAIAPLPGLEAVVTLQLDDALGQATVDDARAELDAAAGALGVTFCATNAGPLPAAAQVSTQLIEVGVVRITVDNHDTHRVISRDLGLAALPRRRSRRPRKMW